MMRPLVVDLDGTLTRSDLLAESFLALLSRQPASALGALMALRHGPAALKARLADQIFLDMPSLPMNEAVLDYLRAEKARGRQLFLASASDQRYVEALAAHLGLFDGVFASHPGCNLAGEAKAERLVQAFGQGGFDYIGNSSVDIPVWEAAGDVLLANVSAGLERKLRHRFADRAVICLTSKSMPLRHYPRALRVHQWLKNLLVFVPTLAAHRIAPEEILTSTLAFGAFCLCASSVYLLNDLLDLQSDRQHHRKSQRPCASGELSLLQAMVLQPLLLLGAGLLALMLPWQFAAVLAIYYAMTLGYSLALKPLAVIDVTTLACLYGLRLFAGSMAGGVALSPWIMAFSMFLFFSLATIKRVAELRENIRRNEQPPVRRGYQLSDVQILEAMAVASGYLAVLVVALYINSTTVEKLYDAPERLWPICVLVLAWISRMLLLTHRGEMHEDPVVFAATDRFSQVTLVIILGIVGISI